MLFRALPFKKGDIVKVGEEEVKIVGFGQRIQGKVIGKNKKIFVNYKDIT